MVTLQWNLTFNGVNTGSAEVHHFLSNQRVANLSKAADGTFSCCRFLTDNFGREDLLFTGTDTGAVGRMLIKTYQ